MKYSDLVDFLEILAGEIGDHHLLVIKFYSGIEEDKTNDSTFFQLIREVKWKDTGLKSPFNSSPHCRPAPGRNNLINLMVRYFRQHSVFMHGS